MSKTLKIEKHLGQRYVFFDGDFRRVPKTRSFCAVCQRDTKSPAHSIYLGNDVSIAIHPDDKDNDCILVPIGPECERRFPTEFLVPTPTSVERAQERDDG